MAEREGIYYGAIGGAADLIPTSVRSDGNGIAAATRAGNINVGENVEKEVLELSESSKAAQEKHAQLLRRVEAEKRARSISVPTSVQEVILRLRQLGEPVTLFGERPADRRERLRQLLAKLQLEADETGIVHRVLEEIRAQPSTGDATALEAREGAGIATNKPQQDQLFYIPIKNPALKQARAAIFAYSVEQTNEKLREERRQKVMEPEESDQLDHNAARLYATARKMTNVASQNGDVRPIAAIRYSRDGKHVATGSWSSLIKVWDSSDASEVKVYRGHTDRVIGLAWHPSRSFSAMSDDSDGVCMCSSSADSTAMLWSAGRDDPVAVLRGHQARLGKIAFHASGDYVGTTSFDHTWRLWDVATGSELLLQEGHYKEVYAIAFQEAGALVATGDLNGVGRVWDIRSGRAILPLQGHSKQILSMDFARNGFLLASASDDRSVRIWDLRQRKCMYTVPAHDALVSDVKFSPTTNELLLSASFDGSVKLWRSRDWKLMATLKGHDGHVMSADFHPDERHVVSSGFDRTFKQWAHESEF
ncbi:TPA: hypothetical protein N0F65_011421 [Lagenidium giganteum]|uniref:Pre-mRNA processing factor 4 (PRP4)-like domain-containing protein n=1 Tax=Lagenidium giganteum TaxID=4803 RepID=A0AAV2ZC15_9STRA|nr:TPA: hypothetical protein N0F65_011421 [Lagenidium giganteum]